MRDDYIRTGLGGQPHEYHEGLGGAGHDLDGFHRDTLHFRDRLTQTVGSGGAAVDQVMVQEAVARFIIGKGKDVAYRPSSSYSMAFSDCYVAPSGPIQADFGAGMYVYCRYELHVSLFISGRFLRMGDLDLRLLSTIMTLCRPQDVRLQELRVETWFPADRESEICGLRHFAECASQT